MAFTRWATARFLPILIAVLALAPVAIAAERTPQGADAGQVDAQTLRAPPLPGSRMDDRVLPAPPQPTSKWLPNRLSTQQAIRLRAELSGALSGSSSSTSALSLPLFDLLGGVANAYAGAPGANAMRHTLVLYDSTGPWGWLGEAYAVLAGQLASHGSAYTLKPVTAYQAGELDAYTGAIYIGSTYEEPLPVAFLDDVIADTRPVLWMNHNIWQLAARHPGFSAHYGWTPLYFDFSATTQVTYKNVALARDPLSAQSGLLQVRIDNPAVASVVASASGAFAPTLPWATRSGNLTYIGEIPFSYVGPNDRYLAAADLIGTVSNPAMPDRKRALVRIEDVGPDADPGELRAIADYLRRRNVPFSVAVYPYYRDPNGVYSNGVPVQATLAQAPGVVSALKYMQARGGTLLMHGYTHQYSNLANPYGGTSADDFEFYLAHIDANDSVIYDGPVPEDSTAWVNGRIDSSATAFLQAGLAVPTIFEAPHYAMSALDYQAVHARFGRRYDRGLYAANWCPNGACGSGTPDYTRIYGQYFPFLVRDVFGSILIPEHLGNVEPEWFNNHPPRLPADILYTAQRTAVVRDGVQSFFFHPYNDIAHLRTIVQGIQGMGYQFVSANTIMQP